MAAAVGAGMAAAAAGMAAAGRLGMENNSNQKVGDVVRAQVNDRNAVPDRIIVLNCCSC